MPVGMHYESHGLIGHLLDFGNHLTGVRGEIGRVYDEYALIAHDCDGVAAHDAGVRLRSDERHNAIRKTHRPVSMFWSVF